MQADNTQTPVVIIPLTRTEAREPHYRWIAPLLGDQVRLVSFGRPAALQTLEEARSVSIGVIRGHAILPTLTERGLVQIDLSLDAKQNAQKLLSRRFDTLCDARMVYLYNWKLVGGSVNELQEGPPITGVTFSWVAAAPGFPEDLADRIRGALDKMRQNGRYQAIIDRWTR